MVKGSIDSIESFGLVDGPGIRTVIFFNGCKLRCKYCHNPEMWQIKEYNTTPEELVKKIIRFKPYYKRNNGGVTFSGGEPLLQYEFLLETCKLLKKENIHIALDTAGVGLGNYDELLDYIDLILLDIKHTDPREYKQLTTGDIKESLKFIEEVNRKNKKVWIRQVIVPNLMDNTQYINNLIDFLQNIKNIERIDFLPYHKLGYEKYQKLNITYPYKDLNEMSKEKTNELYQQFINEFEKKYNKRNVTNN
ncbi:MAG: pyruvate formate lyase-activating protein [Bacilli bacterium]|nr:pyruvate formate lyase-activating protein [Bacilli bacterium]